MVRKPKQASHLLQGLRKGYQLLAPEERDQVRCFILGFHPNGARHSSNPKMLKSASGTLIERSPKNPMEDEKIAREEIWSAIRYLDPDEQEKDKEVNTATIIATLALLLIVGGVWVLLWFRVRQP